MKIDWNIDKNVISEIYIDGENIINPWGFETADSSAFFSLERGIGYRYKLISENYFQGQGNHSFNIINKMQEGKWNLTGNEKILNNSITRRIEAKCLEDSYFMDFVMRFRFKKKYIQFAEIDGKKIFHHNTNIYHQYPVDKVFLQGYKFNILITIKDMHIVDEMKYCMYVRDNCDEWVVHARMLPQIWDKEVIKLCNSWYETKPIPQKAAGLLLKSKKVKNYLWYHNEHNPYKNKILKLINPNAFPIIRLDKNTHLMWDIEVKILERKINGKN